MTWRAVTVRLDPDVTAVEAPAADLVGDALVEAGAEGLEWRDGQRPIEVVGSFFTDEDEAALEQRVAAAVSPLGATVAAVAEHEPIDWSTHWQSHFAPLDFGPLWVVPTWLDAPRDAEVVLRIDPSSAFGTGLHATTALCLEWVVRHRPADLFDVGTGTGVLALAAAKLGATRVLAVDNDPEAVRVAIENRELNRVPAAQLAVEGTPVEEVVGEFTAVIANVLAGPLIELAPAIAARVAPGGSVVLSGLLAYQVDLVAFAYEAEGLVPDVLEVRGEWALVSLARPDRAAGAEALAS